MGPEKRMLQVIHIKCLYLSIQKKKKKIVSINMTADAPIFDFKKIINTKDKLFLV